LRRVVFPVVGKDCGAARERDIDGGGKGQDVDDDDGIAGRLKG
jgi:hypothetical protein